MNTGGTERNAHLQIGEVAQRTDLSFRTIRYYEEVELVVPSGRTRGGFRLYTETDVERLLIVKAMRPLRLNLDETRDMLASRERTHAGTSSAEDEAAVKSYLALAERRLTQARIDLEAAEEAIRLLDRDVRGRGTGPSRA